MGGNTVVVKIPKIRNTNVFEFISSLPHKATSFEKFPKKLILGTTKYFGKCRKLHFFGSLEHYVISFPIGNYDWKLKDHFGYSHV